jgi:hypothetical protein
VNKVTSADWHESCAAPGTRGRLSAAGKSEGDDVTRVRNNRPLSLRLRAAGSRQPSASPSLLRLSSRGSDRLPSRSELGDWLRRAARPLAGFSVA